MAVTTTIQEFYPVYKASKEKKHDWQKFCKVVKASKKNDDEVTEEWVRQKFSYFTTVGYDLTEFEGQKGSRGKAAVDHAAIANELGIPFKADKYKEYKAKQASQRPENIVAVLKKHKGKLTTDQIKNELSMRPATLEKKLADMKAKGKLAGVPELEIA